MILFKSSKFEWQGISYRLKKMLRLEFYYQEFIKHFKHSSVIFNQYFPKMQSQV